MLIEVTELTKRYGRTTAVDDLSFALREGVVTGFVGPNGAGKSTTMRLILGLDRPAAGFALIDGQPYHRLQHPLLRVGALLEARSAHPARSAYHHLLWLAQTHGLGRTRVLEVLELVGLSSVAHKRVGGFSLGMAQRLGLAAALLGDPEALLLDEPMNGLDPQGMAWIRRLLRTLADEGRVVLVSSHLMGEMAHVADRLVVIGGGRLMADTSVAEFVARAGGNRVRIRTPEPGRLIRLLTDGGATAATDGVKGAFTVTGVDTVQVGNLAARHGIPLHELRAEEVSLEEAFLELTRELAEYRAGAR